MSQEVKLKDAVERLERWLTDPLIAGVLREPKLKAVAVHAADIRLLLGEVKRLNGVIELQRSNIEGHPAMCCGQCAKTIEKAEAELAAERERANRKASECHEYSQCAIHFMRRYDVERARAEKLSKALRPAAPDPTPSEDAVLVRTDPSIPRNEIHFINRDGTVAGKIIGLSEQPDLPLGHEFVAFLNTGTICAQCAQPESAHRREP